MHQGEIIRGVTTDRGGEARGLQHPPTPRNSPPAKFASQGGTHVRTDTQIKFLYYPLAISQSQPKKLSLPYIKVHVIRKPQKINESIYRISIQLLPLDMDASFQNTEQ